MPLSRQFLNVFRQLNGGRGVVYCGFTWDVLVFVASYVIRHSFSAANRLFLINKVEYLCDKNWCAEDGMAIRKFGYLATVWWSVLRTVKLKMIASVDFGLKTG